MNHPTLDLLARESEEAACSAATRAQEVDFDNYSECTKFDALVRHVEGLTDTVFKVACVLAKHAEDLEATAEIWRRVTKACDGVLECLAKFTDKHPQCCGHNTYDRILDWRNEAQERLHLHS